MIYEREKSIGATWYLNTYPGVGYRLRSIFRLLCARAVKSARANKGVNPTLTGDGLACSSQYAEIKV